MNHLKSQQV